MTAAIRSCFKALHGSAGARLLTTLVVASDSPVGGGPGLRVATRGDIDLPRTVRGASGGGGYVLMPSSMTTATGAKAIRGSQGGRAGEILKAVRSSVLKTNVAA